MKIEYNKISFNLFQKVDKPVDKMSDEERTQNEKAIKYRNAIHFIPLLEMIDAYNAGIEYPIVINEDGQPKTKKYTVEEQTKLGMLIIDHMTQIPIFEDFRNENHNAFPPETVEGKSRSFAMPKMMSMPAPETTPEEEVKETEVEANEVQEELPAVETEENPEPIKPSKKK